MRDFNCKVPMLKANFLKENNVNTHSFLLSGSNVFLVYNRIFCELQHVNFLHKLKC